MQLYREEQLRRKGKLIDAGLTHEELASRFYRASGECICSECGRDYYSHPYASEARDRDDQPYLHIICNGDIVKL